jgi:murein DD-endopeptidase MepM/ murein hydrolase activator NlpD
MSRVYAPSRQTGGVRFLTLPFDDPNVKVNQGWVYSWGSQHYGTDYVLGGPEVSRLQKFDIVASADGYACGNCTSRQGNAVWVEHKINGSKYYTYYGHLASIDKNIPLGSQSRTVFVKQGQFLGWAGDTGAGKGVLHLHYALMDANSVPIDPYSIGKLRQHYPSPRSNTPGIGWFMSALEPSN